MKPITPKDLPERVLSLLQQGRRMTRGELVYRTGASDRQVRDAISQLRGDGYPIVSNSGEAGYHLDPSKVDQTIADMESRIQKMSLTVKALRRGRGKAVQMRLV